MKQPVFLLFIGILLLGLMAAGCGGKPITPAPQAVTELTVSAAVSLKDALAEIRTHYEKKNPGVKLIYNLGASGTLQKQIEQGAPADLFISAAPKQMNELEQKNLLNNQTGQSGGRISQFPVQPCGCRISHWKCVSISSGGSWCCLVRRAAARPLPCAALPDCCGLTPGGSPAATKYFSMRDASSTYRPVTGTSGICSRTMHCFRT